MSTILEQLYNGQIFPDEQLRPCIESCRAAHREQQIRCAVFREHLRRADAKLEREFDDVMDSYLDAVTPDFSSAWIDGFRLGAKMTAELFAEPT